MSGRARAAARPIRAALAVAAAALVAGAPAARAASHEQLRAQARAVAIVPGAGGPGERAALDQLGRLALAFLDAADEDVRGAAGAFEAIAGPLERSYDAHRAALDRMSRAVIEADGDMDALYETPAWQDHQALAAQALYYLNWLRYRGALLYDGARRTQLLERAASGFSEFATASGESPVVIESHLGRGLVYMELGHGDWAVADFEAVVQAKSAAPERVRKARLALAEAYIKAGRSADALRASEAALGAAAPADLPRARLTRARALLMAAAAQPARRASYQAEARALLAQVQAAGGAWGRRAEAIVRAGLDNPRVWAGATAKAEPPPPSEWDVTKQLVAQGKLKEAVPRLERVLASSAAEDRARHAEARYLLGLARFRQGDMEGAAATLDAVAAEKGDAYYRVDALYLRFKAREALYAKSEAPELLPAYREAIADLLRRHPKHKAAAEARFRLGEIHQRAGRFVEAAAEYAQVKGDPAFELRAAFATAQCAVKRLEETPEGARPDAALRREAEDALAAFRERVRGGDAVADASVASLEGQAALMSAYLAALAEPPDWAQALVWLDGYEDRYPGLAAEGPQVLKLRLTALARLGRLEAAAREAERPDAGALEAAFLDDLAGRFLTLAAREKAKGDAAAAAAGRRAALALAERALAAEDAAALGPAARRRLRTSLAALYDERGDAERALALYRAVLADYPEALGARAGAARVLEGAGRAAEARALWDELGAAPPGKAGWLEARYQSARLSVELGERERACSLLREVPPGMLADTHAPTPQKIQDLLRSACAS